jgi:hypothetical protein
VLALLATGTEAEVRGKTQIVLQWLQGEQPNLELQAVHKIEDELEELGGGRYFVDGHDYGGGTINIFLYADDAAVDSAIAIVVKHYEDSKLPKGLRIGRAMYENKERTDWHFLPVYPPGLAAFDITYRK